MHPKRSWALQAHELHSPQSLARSPTSTKQNLSPHVLNLTSVSTANPPIHDNRQYQFVSFCIHINSTNSTLTWSRVPGKGCTGTLASKIRQLFGQPINIFYVEDPWEAGIKGSVKLWKAPGISPDIVPAKKKKVEGWSWALASQSVQQQRSSSSYIQPIESTWSFLLVTHLRTSLDFIASLLEISRRRFVSSCLRLPLRASWWQESIRNKFASVQGHVAVLLSSGQDFFLEADLIYLLSLIIWSLLCFPDSTFVAFLLS